MSVPARRPAPHVTADPWQDAEQLFRTDPRWRGGDDAYSIPLGDDRHLWLFGDTFVDTDGTADRRAAHFVHNTVAIQTGSKPGTADLEFAWGDGEQPRAVFEDPELGVYLWPGHGAAVDDRLLLFFMRVRNRAGTTGQLTDDPETVTPFELLGWTARLYDGIDGHPTRWRRTDVLLPDLADIELVGIGGVLLHDDHLYAHAIGPGSGAQRPVLLARWPLDAVTAGDLASPSWWGGTDQGWIPADGQATATGLAALTEFTVHYDPAREVFVAVQLRELRTGRLEIRVADRVHGPWSDPAVVMLPQGRDPDVNVYAGKAHPAMDGEGLLVTFATNGTTPETVYAREDLYYPHCLRVHIR